MCGKNMEKLKPAIKGNIKQKERSMKENVEQKYVLEWRE